MFVVSFRCVGTPQLASCEADRAKSLRERESTKGRAEHRVDWFSTGPKGRCRGRLFRESRSFHHPQMPADGLTKAELVKTHDALEHLIKISHFTLVLEQAVMQQMAEIKLQSRAAAHQTRRETTQSPSEATDNLLQSAPGKALVTVSCATKPANSGQETRFWATSSRDLHRDKTEQSSGLRYRAETVQRAVEIASLQQAVSVALTLVESKREETSREF